jgi:hypothetical protein
MYEIDTTSFLAFIQTMFRLAGGSLRLDPAVFQAAFNGGPTATPVLIWIVLLGGVSLMIGQSVVLFANRVNTTRFAISLALGALKFFLDVMLVVVVAWWMANSLGARPWSLGQIGRAIALASAPHWLSLFFLIPYFGLIWERLTKIYVLLALIIAIQAVFNLSFFNALLASLTASLISHIASLIISRLLTPLSDRLTRSLVGDVELTSTKQIYEMFARLNL